MFIKIKLLTIFIIKLKLVIKIKIWKKIKKISIITLSSEKFPLLNNENIGKNLCYVILKSSSISIK